MKSALLYFTMSCLQIVNVFAHGTIKSDTATVIIQNSTNSNITIQEECSPYYLINEYRNLKKTDTIKIVSSVPFRLVFSEINTDGQNTYKTFWLQPDEQVHIIKSALNLRSSSNLGQIRGNELNFFSRMQDSLGNFEGLMTYIPHKRKEPETLLDKVQEIYRNRLQFLNEYKKQNTISTTYESTIRKILYYRQYTEFLDHCHLDGLLDKQLLNSKKINLFIDDYLTQKEDSSNIYYLEVQKWFAKLYHLNEEKNYFELYYTLKGLYSGFTLEYLSADIIDWSVGNAHFSQLFEDFIGSAKSEELKKYLISRYGEYLASDLEIENPVNQSNQTLLYHLKSKRIVSWEDLLHQDGVKYLDFWASWCGGCRESMPKLKSLQAELTNSHFKVIYISIDEKSGMWEKVSRKEGLPDENSYLMLNPAASKVKKEYNISILPRYMIVNSSGQITHISAPNIHSPDLKGELEELLK